MKLLNWFKRFIKRHIVDDFPYEDACFMCHLGGCKGCPVLEMEQ